MLTEDQLRRELDEQKPGTTVFNNFHGVFPGGFKRAYSADDVAAYLVGDRKPNPARIDRIHRDMKLWVEVDKLIIEFGHDLGEVFEWVMFGDLESDHIDLMIKVFVRLVNMGYERRELVG